MKGVDLELGKLGAAMLLVFTLAFTSQSALAATFNLFQDGFVGGGTITGTFTGEDVNLDGAIDSSFGEVSGFTANWSGNGTVGATTWQFDDLNRVVYELGTGDIGDDGICCGIEGLLAFNLDGFVWDSGNGPGGFENAPGGGVGDPAGAISLTDNLIQVSSVPLPAAAWLFGSALLGLGAMKRKRT